ncbi:hypothetical protein ZWY2020_032615 [Hordeum vulgare]|nr:hypothetical protein ZWY2020_032615 [Hordeum vulgare]
MATGTETPAAAPCLLLGPPLIRAAHPSPAAGTAAGDDTDASHPFLDLLDAAFNALSATEMKAALTQRRVLRNSGRIILAQISAGSAIPLVGVLLLALPNEPATFAHHGVAWILSMVWHLVNPTKQQ